MRPIVVVLLTLGLHAPALAQASSPPQSCDELYSGFPALNQGEGFEIVETEDGCTIRNGYYRASELVRYKFAAVTIKAPDLFRRLAAELPPASADITASGIRVIPDIGDPLHEYATEIQVEPFDMHIAYRWDETTGELDLTDASISGKSIGRIALVARVAGLTADAFADARTGIPPTVTLKTISARLENRSIFELFVAAPLLYLLPSGEDPRPRIADFQQQATALVGALPDAIMDADSKAVITTFIADFPHPEGDYRLDIAFPHGLDPVSLIGKDLADLLENPPEVTVTATN